MLITEIKKQDYIFNAVLAECIKESGVKSKSEIRTAFLYAGVKPSREDYKYIYENTLEV